MHSFGLLQAISENLLESNLRHVVAVVQHLKTVLELDYALHVQALGRVPLEAFHNKGVDKWVNLLFGRVELQLLNVDFCLAYRGTLERVHLGHQVVETTAKRPGLGLFGKVALANEIIVFKRRCGVAGLLTDDLGC